MSDIPPFLKTAADMWLHNSMIIVTCDEHTTNRDCPCMFVRRSKVLGVSNELCINECRNFDEYPQNQYKCWLAD